MLLRVVENLVRNAAEAGATALAVSVEPAGAFRRVLLRDNGPGLPAKAQENLFRPVFRVGPTRWDRAGVADCPRSSAGNGRGS